MDRTDKPDHAPLTDSDLDAIRPMKCTPGCQSNAGDPEFNDCTCGAAEHNAAREKIRAALVPPQPGADVREAAQLVEEALRLDAEATQNPSGLGDPIRYAVLLEMWGESGKWCRYCGGAAAKHAGESAAHRTDCVGLEALALAEKWKRARTLLPALARALRAALAAPAPAPQSCLADFTDSELASAWNRLRKPFGAAPWGEFNKRDTELETQFARNLIDVIRARTATSEPPMHYITRGSSDGWHEAACGAHIEGVRFADLERFGFTHDAAKVQGCDACVAAACPAPKSCPACGGGCMPWALTGKSCQALMAELK